MSYSHEPPHGYDPHRPVHDPQRPPYDPYADEQGRPPRRRREGEGAHRAALVIQTVADIAAVVLGLWILLYLLGANQGNVFVGFVEGLAGWLAGWSQDIFTMETEGLRVFLNFGLPALIYLGIGHGIAARLRSA